MKHRKLWRSSILVGGFGLILAATVAGAQESDSPRAQPTPGSGGAATNGSNFPAASAATTSPRSNGDTRSRTSREAHPGDPDPEGDPALPRIPPEGYAPPLHPEPERKPSPEGKFPPADEVPSEGKVPPQGWQMGSKGTLIQLEELAPVEVIDLQERLRGLGLYHAALDGVPGPQTRQALQRYFIKQAQLALQGQVDASALNLFDVIPTSHPQPL
jgi:hypothetical protein